MRIRDCLLSAALAPLLIAAAPVAPAETARYELTLRNTNQGQNFSPPVAIVHDEAWAPFTVGEPAGAALSTLAEEGDPAGFRGLAQREAAVHEVVFVAKLHRRRSPVRAVRFTAPAGARLSIVTMMTLTNDGFAGVRSLALPVAVGTATEANLTAFDAGSEANTESCDHVPCTVHGRRMIEGAEGAVAPHPGLRGDRDIPAARGWPGSVVGTVRVVRLP